MHGIMELDARAGRMQPVLTSRNSESFKGCNDLHIASNGDIYFTDQGQTGLYRRPPAHRDEAHRRCERVSRLIVKLRGHGLVAKIPRARRYRVTRYGHRVMTAAIALHDHGFPDRYLAAA